MSKNKYREALQWALDWIDAVPADTALPAMPGFDRDYVNDLLAAPAMPAPPSTAEQPRPEQVLRRLLAYHVAGAKLYADDGELQDNTAHPCVDFKRDSVDAIETKLGERGRAALAAKAPQQSLTLNTEKQ